MESTAEPRYVYDVRKCAKCMIEGDKHFCKKMLGCGVN
jgi:hypothetical protein